MTIREIEAAPSDDALFDLIARELEARLPPRNPIEPFLTALRILPPGLRAMAAIYELDVSIALDDLGWHFGNWHHAGLAEETILGFGELGAKRMAEIVHEVFQLAQLYWSELGSENWTEWYNESPLEESLGALNREAEEIWHKLPRGFLSYWLSYARQHPEKLVDENETNGAARG